MSVHCHAETPHSPLLFSAAHISAMNHANSPLFMSFKADLSRVRGSSVHTLRHACVRAPGGRTLSAIRPRYCGSSSRGGA